MTAPYLLTPALGKGVRAMTAKRMMALATTRLVDLALFSDSNALQGGYGWDYGLQSGAISAGFSQYASNVTPPGSNQGYLTYWASTPNGATTGLGSEHSGYLLPTNFNYYYQASVAIGNNIGIGVEAGNGLNVNASLQAQLAYLTFSSGGGSFIPRIRRENSPFSNLVTGSSVSCIGSDGAAVATIGLSAASRDYPLAFHYQGTTASTAKTALLWARVIDTSKTSGWSLSTVYGEGGQSMYDLAAWALAQSDAALTNHFTAIRLRQVAAGQTPLVVCVVNFGLNDRNETSQPSLGPGAFTDPDSAEAYIDNLKAFVARIERIWALNGWARSGLSFWIIPGHPVSTPDDAELIAYRAAASAWVATRPDASFTDISELITADQMLTNGWYASGGADRNHLVQAGYVGIGALIMATVQ